MRIICNLIFIFLLFLTARVEAEEKYLSADRIEYNADEQYIEATGKVRIAIDKYIIHSDKIFYDIEKNEVWSHGHVTAYNNQDQIAVGESALLRNHAKQIVISSFVLYFKKSDAIIAAKLAERLDEKYFRLSKATFTSCPTCNKSKPLWQISAKKADILQDEHKIIYKNMFFEIYGVPVAYFPYFSHHLPGASPKSGILMPDIKGKKFGIPLYYRPKNNFDATVTPRFGKKGLLYEGEVRHLLKKGSYELTGSITSNKKNVSVVKDDLTISKRKMRRFHVAGRGDFLNDTVHYGFNINRVSDIGFLREYHHRHDPFLVSNIYGYNVRKENFIEVNNLMIEGLKVQDKVSNDPRIIPEVNFRQLVQLPTLWDSKLRIDNYSSVYSSDDIGRISRTIWEINLYNSHITDNGQVIGVELYNRADLYNVDRDFGFQNTHYTTGRYIPEFRTSVKYPLVSRLENKSLVFEPITLLAIGRELKTHPRNLNLIDSSEYEFDDNNFLRYNRYNGYDYYEYGQRITYGANSVLQTDSGYKIGMFMGQYQKLGNQHQNKPDIVGKLYVNLHDNLELYYRFKKRVKNFNSVFDECGIWYTDDDITFNGNFINLNKLHLEEQSRIRQIYLDTGYNYSQNWNFGFNTRVDLTKSRPRQLMHGIRVTYHGDCVSISSTISRDYTSDSLGVIKKNHDYSFVIGLKTINM